MSDEEKNSLVELKIPGDPEYLRVVRLMVSGYASNLPFPVDEIEDIKVAVSEACNCAISHVDGARASEPITISCWTREGNLYFKIEDKGKAITEDEFNDFTSAECGLGFLLIRTLMDELDVKPGSDYGTCVVMSKRITAS